MQQDIEQAGRDTFGHDIAEAATLIVGLVAGTAIVYAIVIDTDLPLAKTAAILCVVALGIILVNVADAEEDAPVEKLTEG